jgi:hypothetical protein
LNEVICSPGAATSFAPAVAHTERIASTIASEKICRIGFIVALPQAKTMPRPPPLPRFVHLPLRASLTR